MTNTKSYVKQKVVIPGNSEETVAFACACFVELAREKIEQNGIFSIALSGGSTPKKLYQTITKDPYKNALDWSRVLLFWSDERAKPLTHKESNYHMAMVEGNLQSLPIDKQHIFPMQVESYQKDHAKKYEDLIRKGLGSSLFDVVLLGVGEDGHTASLFPGTELIDEKQKLVAAAFVTKKNMWRMTLTFPCINQSQKAVVFALGKNKANIVKSVLSSKGSMLPAAKVGSAEKKAIWIVDNDAGMLL